MSTYTYLNVHQDEGVVFDDIAALNKDLTDAGCGELLEDIESIQIGTDFKKNWQDNYIPYDGRVIDFVVQDEDGKVKFASVDDGHTFCGHTTEYILVWSCFYINEMKIIANHMTAGKLVFRFAVEGDPDEYFSITPVSITKQTLKF